MILSLSRRHARGFRMFALLLVALIWTTALGCNGRRSGAATTTFGVGTPGSITGFTLEGPNQTGAVAAATTLRPLIVTFRANQGLATAFDPIADLVALEHNNSMIAIQTLTPIIPTVNLDFATRYTLRGGTLNPSGSVGFYLARGYGTAAEIFAAMQTAPSVLLSPTHTRLGIASGGSTVGNYWTILFY